jgi:hypothetical protein
LIIAANFLKNGADSEFRAWVIEVKITANRVFGIKSVFRIVQLKPGKEPKMNSLKFGKSITKCLHLMILLLVVVLLVGCQGSGEPRLRFGAFFGSPVGLRFTEPGKLGNHSFGFTLNETNGMVYTCQGGFIDVAHVREAADRTAYLHKITYKNLIQGKKKFSFHVIEPSRYQVTLSYPKNWDDYPIEEKEAIAKDLSINFGQYLAHTSLIWHEIVTWYGFASAGIFPDTISAFSWEDPYSDILGTRLAAQALHDQRRQYDEAMTELIFQTLQELDVQPARVAKEAAKRIEGRWYTGGFYFLVDMKRRNLDVGLDDYRITPWLVPGICPDAEPRLYPVPGVELLCSYGFDFEVEIEPNIMEKGKIYHSIGLAGNKRIRPQVDFPRIMAFINKQENETVVSVAIQ